MLSSSHPWRVSLVINIFGGSDGKESACQCRRLRFNCWVVETPWKGNGNPLHYSCLGNAMDRGAWWATVHEVAKSQTWLSDWNNSNQMKCRGPVWGQRNTDQERPPISSIKSCLQTKKKKACLFLFLLPPLALPRQENNWISVFL